MPLHPSASSGALARAAIAPSLALLLGLVALSGAAFAHSALAGPRRLAQLEIATRLSGFELTDKTLWALAFWSDGRMTIYKPGASRRGVWNVEQDTLCIAPRHMPRRCYEVWMLADEVELRREGAPTEVYWLQAPMLPHPLARRHD